MSWETPTNQVRDPATQPPLAPGNPQADYLTGSTGAAATLAAIFQRESTGRGQLVDISGQEANANHIRTTISTVVHTPDLVTGREKTNFDFLVPCSDGYVFLTPYNFDHWWERLQHLMGDPGVGAERGFRHHGRTAPSTAMRSSRSWPSGRRSTPAPSSTRCRSTSASRASRSTRPPR